MHRQRSTQSLRSLKLGACHYLVNCLLVILGCGFLATGLIINDSNWIWTGSLILAACALSVFLFFILTYSWKCPLCLGRIWVNTGCRRHRNATKALGISYRLGVALATITGKPYRCPYCGEPFSTTKTRK